MFNGLTSNLGDLVHLSDACSLSISPENFTGEKGKGGMATEGTGAAFASELGPKWKISPSVAIKSGETFTLGEINGSGAVTYIWITPLGTFRDLILRMYWDGCEKPSVECPIGDFFAHPSADNECLINSLAVCCNPLNGFNCYWHMPFKKSARITLENTNDRDIVVYYQIDYTLTDIPDDSAYFHAQFRRVNPLPYKQDYVILDGIRGKGHYVGTHLFWGSNNSRWWGEGEMKFFIDGDEEYPTICGTGVEDYFCGAMGFAMHWKYKDFSTAYTGFYPTKTDTQNLTQHRFSMYRWHITDPIRFDSNLRVTVQALGWRSEAREVAKYLPLQDDISSVAYWYQSEQCLDFPELPDRDYRELI